MVRNLWMKGERKPYWGLENRNAGIKGPKNGIRLHLVMVLSFSCFSSQQGAITPAVGLRVSPRPGPAASAVPPATVAPGLWRRATGAIRPSTQVWGEGRGFDPERSSCNGPLPLGPATTGPWT